MIYFTNYAEKKFEILNNHKIYFRKEAIEEAVNNPEIKSKIGKLSTAQKGNIKVIYKIENNLKKIITFYPYEI